MLCPLFSQAVGAEAVFLSRSLAWEITQIFFALLLIVSVFHMNLCL